MYRILIAECKQEVSSFNPVPSHYGDFEIAVGEALLSRHRGVQSEIAGALTVFEARDDVEIIPTYGAHAMTSGGWGQSGIVVLAEAAGTPCRAVMSPSVAPLPKGKPFARAISANEPYRRPRACSFLGSRWPAMTARRTVQFDSPSTRR